MAICEPVDVPDDTHFLISKVCRIVLIKYLHQLTEFKTLVLLPVVLSLILSIYENLTNGVLIKFIYNSETSIVKIAFYLY
jgi:hypothetical protein